MIPIALKDTIKAPRQEYASEEYTDEYLSKKRKEYTVEFTPTRWQKLCGWECRPETHTLSTTLA